MNQFINTFHWTLKILVALGIFLSSLGKLEGNPGIIEMFEEWGYPVYLVFGVGIIELILAIMLVYQKTTRYSAIGIILMMIIALVTHLIHDPLEKSYYAMVFIICSSIILLLDQKVRNYRRSLIKVETD